MVDIIWKNFKRNGFITKEEQELLKSISMQKTKKGVATSSARKAQEILWHLNGEPFLYFNDLNQFVYSYNK